MSYEQQYLKSSAPLLHEFYTKLYAGKEKHDSPERSRVQLMRELVAILKEKSSHTYVCNIGAGRQSLEKQLLAAHGSKQFLRNVHFLTIDRADIQHHKLLTNIRDQVTHLQADGLALPVADNSIDVVISNLAIDFLPRVAFSEVHRVLQPDGTGLFNFHHPQMLEGVSRATTSVGEYWQSLIEHDYLFQSTQQIEEVLAAHNLIVEEIDLQTHKNHLWWFVKAHKATQD